MAEQIIINHVIWSLGAGLLPIPLFDIAAVTAIQIDMLKNLAALYEVDYSKSTGKAFVSALTGSTFAKIGSSFVKAIPGLGQIIGGISMSVLSGASTYGIGQVIINHFEQSGTLLDVDMKWAKEAYKEAFDKGKEFVAGIKKEKNLSDDEVKDIFEKLQKLAKLRDDGAITEEEYQAKKKDLLERL